MRWLLAVVATLVLAASAFVGWVYFKSEAVLHRRYPLPAAAALPALGADGPSQGAHLAIIYGCTDCHGDDLRGRPFSHPDPFRQVNSANLTLKAVRYSDTDFARAIRQGLSPTGESVEFMPSNAFTRMSDAEVAAIVAYVRSLPRGGADIPAWDVGRKARWQLATGKFPPGMALMADAARQSARDMGPPTQAGRRLVSVACVECHGGDLKGQKGGPPDLAIVGAYDPDDFRRLLKTGVAAGGRQLSMMSPTARKRFSHLTDAEVESIRLYLVARANAPA
jgi:mono/diheme cytochrome c family protein